MKTLFLLIFFTFFAYSIDAQWSNNSAVNNPVAVQPGSKQYPAMCTDGSGGAIVAWMDFDLGNYAIYAQRINANGIIQWQIDGISVSGSQCTSPGIVSDGAGGAIITWTGNNINNEDIYAQRISGAGAIQWAANGVVICNAANTQNTTSIIADGNNGAIITWKDERTAIAPDAEIYAQKINGNGNVQWTANGVKLSTSSDYLQVPKLVLDGTGGAIITWTNATYDICCQRINSNGVIQWAVNGVVISNVVGTQREADITTDGNGGAIISWEGNSGGYNIYAQRVLNNGTTQWAANGELICNAASNQNFPKIVSGGSGSAIITWQDFRNGGSNPDIYAQKINGNGVIAWTQDGIALCNDPAIQINPLIASDGNGGAIITWGDKRNGAANADMYAQRISDGGVVLWVSDGTAVCTAIDNQENQQIVADGNGGAIISWEDRRNGYPNPNIYAQRITSYGALAIGNDDLEITKQISIFPNPSNGIFSIKSNFNYLNMAVRNMLGQIVYSELLTDLDNKINIAHIPSGIYFIEFASVNSSKEFSITKTILLER